jgi:hypothetical protein
MAEQLPIGRGPRPWRDARSRDDWIALLAWAQFGAVLAFAALIALLAWSFADFGDIACFDADDPGCARPAERESWFGAPEAVASVVVVAAAALAVVMAWQLRRGAAPRAMALIALAAPLPLALAAGALTGIPF